MKKAFLLIFVSVVFSTLMVFCINAQAETDLPGESVYASAEKQKEIAEKLKENDEIIKLLTERECCVLIESITPVYCIDPLEVINTGEWNLYPSKHYPLTQYQSYIGCGTLGDEPELYVAKAIDYKGINSYDIKIRVDGDSPWLYTSGKKIEYGGWSKTSYADHKERIRDCLAREDFGVVTDEDVRYVMVLGIECLTEWNSHFNYGSAFFVSKNGKEALVNIETYAGLFCEKDKTPVGWGAPQYNVQCLTEDNLMQRFCELKEKRDAELTYIRLSKKMGFDTDEIERSFIHHYKDNISSNYNNKDILHVLHIRDYVERNKFTMMTYYPKPEKLIGTRYSVLETEEVKKTETLPESFAVTDVETDVPIKGDEKQTANKIYILLTIVGICVVVICGTIVFVKRSKNNKPKE